MKFFWILLFWAICSNAALTEENVTLKLLQEHLIIKTKDGFHINQEAPAKVFFDNADKPLRPFTINARQLDFNLGCDKTAPFQLHFYVCDDQLTSCVPYKGTYRVHGEELIKVDLLDNAGDRKSVV